MHFFSLNLDLHVYYSLIPVSDWFLILECILEDELPFKVRERTKYLSSVVGVAKKSLHDLGVFHQLLFWRFTVNNAKKAGVAGIVSIWAKEWNEIIQKLTSQRFRLG